MNLRLISVPSLALAGLLGAATFAVPASAQLFGSPAPAANAADDGDTIATNAQPSSIQSQPLAAPTGNAAQPTYAPAPNYSAAPAPGAEPRLAAPVELNPQGQQSGQQQFGQQPQGQPAPVASAPGGNGYSDGYRQNGGAPDGLRPPAGINETASAAPGSTAPMAPNGAPGAPLPGNAAPGANGTIAGLPPDDQPEQGQPKELPPNLRRQTVEYFTKEPVGTIIIDTPNTYLYLVIGKNLAMRYGIGVGREGFTWSGKEKISRMAEWPDWFPPSEMIERQPYLPRFMAGGESNPLGARALYIGNTLYRIHGTNQPSTIGSFVSSGCIRLINSDIEDLYTRVKVGTKIVVLPGNAPATASNTAAPQSH
jgi:lipoprotein-anchoring transpeptidase ErfK/SrfK